MKVVNQVHQEDGRRRCHRLQAGAVQQEHHTTDDDVPTGSVPLFRNPKDPDGGLAAGFDVSRQRLEQPWAGSRQGSQSLKGDVKDTHQSSTCRAAGLQLRRPLCLPPDASRTAGGTS